MTTGGLERGRASFARNSWGVAYTQFADADGDTPLDLDDLERFALAAYLTGRNDVATQAWTRAHHDALLRDDPRRAARHAVLIGSGLMFRGEVAPSLGWFARGARVLEGCGECPEGAWLRVWHAFARMWGGDPTTAEPTFTESVQAGERFGDLDLVSMARLGEGMCLVLQGHGPAGVALLDEVMAGVTSGEVSPMYAGIAYCTVIAACSDLFDLRRAREWTAALTRWCDAQPDLVPYRGNCLVHRCELMRLQGAWHEAIRAAEQACDLLSGPVTWDTLGAAYYQLGELQRLRGEFIAAEESYRRAGEAGRPPEPGLALLRLAQGRIDLASAVIRRAVAETDDPPLRARVLPAFVEIMIAAGDVPAARTAADELAQLATALHFFISAVQAVVPTFEGPAEDEPLLEFQVADPDVLHRRLTDAGLTNVTVDTTHQERIQVRTGQQLWNWCLGGNPIPGQLVADLTDKQRDDIIHVLDGMIRERSTTNGPAVLSAPLNIGVGTK